MRRVVLVALLLLLGACEQPDLSETAVGRAPAEPAASQPAEPAPSPPRAASEALPRSVAGVSLGGTVAEVEGTLGALDCHDNPAGFRVCKPRTPPAGAPGDLDVFLFEERVVSLAYQSDIGPDVWNYLNDLLKRYGSPSLNGTNERDKSGRVHEIYGWKDDRTLYSVRFVWDGETADRKLSTTIITMWDRESYGRWEQTQKPAPPTAAAVGEPA